MKVENAYTDFVLENSHNGIGALEKKRVFSKEDFKTKIDFIDYVILKPGETIGKHTHGKNEEIYFFIEGNAKMVTNGEEREMSPGDVIINSYNDTHEVINEGREIVKLYIFQVTA